LMIIYSDVKKTVFQFSKNSEKIILANYQNDVLSDKYMEFDSDGALRIQGQYSQENKAFTEIFTEYNLLTFEEQEIKKTHTKSPKKVGQWFYYDVYGNLEKVEEH